MVMNCNHPEFWETRYQSQQTPWDLNQPAPPFVSLKETLPQLRPGKMAVLGAGRGHDAAYFGQQGFDVTGFDYAEGGVAEARQRYGQWALFEHQDIFNIPDCYAGQFDYVLEHTCYCAILPERRDEYTQAVHRLLKPQGRLIGLFWLVTDPDGPPYPTTMAEIETRFGWGFDLEFMLCPLNSIETRRQTELLCVLKKR